MRRVILQRSTPTHQDVVNRGGADNWFARHRQLDRMKDEGTGLPPTQAAVEGDQLLERTALLEDRIVEAVDEDVRGVREAIRAS